MLISDVLNRLEKIAPSGLAQPWDNVGLLIGDGREKVKDVLLAVDITDAVAEEAASKKCGLIVSYHPVIFEGLKKITPAGDKPVVFKLIKNNIAACSVHTSLDVVCGGVNDGLAEMIGLQDTSPIGEYVEDTSVEGLYRLVVFIPTAYVDKVSKAVFDAGAGRLGSYSECGFFTEGVGSFRPLEGSNPAIGTRDRLEQVEEYRFETIVKASHLANVVAAMKTAHPYEMPAYDIISLETERKRYGIGRIGRLKKALTLNGILDRLKAATGCKSAGIIGRKTGKFSRAAVCAGSCGSVIREVVKNDSQIYITGELKHHDALYAQESGLSCICLGHSVSERFMLSKLKSILSGSLEGVNFHISRKDKDPFTWKQL
ncbi:metal-binding protein [Limihaloglobus sulfuriphilus]|uniref:GTP cyclohydrolase 1 type 2 homolog n=1 Tax=Limihaloglobus sulfuriphilus TaxID=1851148 RepID=A0A1Q2MF09_9BACT|nr:Nif3-like dinuclear metal center hexameric protein [Limihaloglobus sulfuriphilus]AQQ70877.1 metal-binding protein [Limihaloglobus sulfuriphilus]